MSLEIISSGRCGMSRSTTDMATPNRSNSGSGESPTVMPTTRTCGASRAKQRQLHFDGVLLAMGRRVEFQPVDAAGQSRGQLGVRGQFAAGKQPPPVRAPRPSGRRAADVSDKE